jgi:hypothetical protein
VKASWHIDVIFIVSFCNLFFLFGLLNHRHVVLYADKDVLDVLVPLHGGVCHAEVHFSNLAGFSVLLLVRDLHRTVEVADTGVIVALLNHQLTKLHEGTALALAVLELAGQFKVTFNEHLELVLVHLSIYLVSSNLAEISDGHTLAGNTGHLDCVPERELVVDG